MRIEVERNAFARLLAQVTKVVEARNTIPILSCVRLVVDGGELTASATDLDIEISGSIPVGDSNDVGLCVDAKMLVGIVGKMNADRITMDVADREVVIKGGRSRFKLPTMPPADYPSLQHGDFDVDFKMDLAALIAPVKFAQSTEETRYYLKGIYLYGTAKEVVATATDGHRLSTNRGAKVGKFAGVIVSTKMVNMVPAGTIGVSLNANKIRLAAEGATITGRLVDGTYPEFERVIPTDNDKLVTFDNAAVKAAVERVNLVRNDAARALRIDIHSDEMLFTVRGDGEALDSVAIEYTGEPTFIGFNSQYVVDALSNMPNGPIRVAIKDNGSPALLTSAAAEGLRVVLMPMRVG